MEFVTFAGFFIFLFWLMFKVKKGRASTALEKAEAEIRELSGRILVVSSGEIPGRDTKSVLGYVSGSSRIEASTAEETDAAQAEAKLAIMRNALDMGANAIIGINLSSSSYQKQGSQWMVAKHTYSGTAVIV